MLQVDVKVVEASQECDFDHSRRRCELDFESLYARKEADRVPEFVTFTHMVNREGHGPYLAHSTMFSIAVQFVSE